MHRAPKRFDAGWLGPYAKSKTDGRSQIAYDERFLAADAAREIQPDEAAKASVFRVAFFLHVVNSGKPLKYARVEASLPPVTPAPECLQEAVQARASMITCVY